MDGSENVIITGYSYGNISFVTCNCSKPDVHRVIRIVVGTNHLVGILLLYKVATLKSLSLCGYSILKGQAV